MDFRQAFANLIKRQWEWEGKGKQRGAPAGRPYPLHPGIVIFNRHTAEFSAKLFENIVSLCQSIHSTDRSHLRHEEVDKLGSLRYRP